MRATHLRRYHVTHGTVPDLTAWRSRLATALMVCTLGAAGPALADGPFPDMLTSADRDRLSVYDPIRRDILKYVHQHAGRLDREELNMILAGSAIDLAPADMAGDWRCRSIQMWRDPGLPIIIYGDFRCRVTDDGAGLRLEKLTGSQRTAGTFYDLGETRLGYAGAQALGNETSVPRYGAIRDRNQVGYLMPVSHDRMRLEFPRPVNAEFEILELRR